MSNTRIPTYAVLALLTASVAACGVTVAQAEVKVTNLCVPYNGVTIQGVDPGTTEVDHQFTYTKLAALQNLAQEIQNLQFVSLSATAVSGITDLSFIQAANVTVASGDPSSPLPTIDVYDCDGNCVPNGNTLDVPATFQVSALAYIETGSVVVDLEVDGELPINDWVIDISACFQGTLDYGESL
jgi:hypothetical protein